MPFDIIDAEDIKNRKGPKDDTLDLITSINDILNMHGKGDLYVKDIRQIAARLLELTKNNNPDYCWSFQ